MKKFKKLIPALCMLLISAVLMGTSTYAWFSMNKTVTAEGMEVIAKSNSTYLLIGNVDNASTIQTAQTTKANAAYADSTTNADKKVYPAAYYMALTTMPGTLAEGVNGTIKAKTWYTANNNKVDASTSAITRITELVEGEMGSYRLTYKTYLVLSKDSTNLSSKIKVTFARADGADESVSAVVVIGDEEFAYNTIDKTASQVTTKKVDLSTTTCYEVTVYVYIDGNGSNVYSDYINGKDEEAGKAITGTMNITFDLVD